MLPPANLIGATRRARVAIIQTKPQKGRYAENLDALREAFAQLAQMQPHLVVMPEGALTGYFLEGAVYELALPATRFAHDVANAWRDACGDQPVALASGFFENDGGTYYNSAAYVNVCGDHETIAHIHRKMFLPTYGVFDEERFLSRGRRLAVFESDLGRAAMLICEDVWHSIMPTIAAVKGARLLIVPSAAPGRGVEGADGLTSVARWHDILRAIAAEHGVYVVYAGLTGFEGGKGMSGSSCVIDPRGEIIVSAPATGACIVRADIDLGEIDLARANMPLLGDLSSVLPDLLLDETLPLPRGGRDARDR